jgi:hypothetical protein
MGWYIIFFIIGVPIGIWIGAYVRGNPECIGLVAHRQVPAFSELKCNNINQIATLIEIDRRMIEMNSPFEKRLQLLRSLLESSNNANDSTKTTSEGLSFQQPLPEASSSHPIDLHAMIDLFNRDGGSDAGRVGNNGGKLNPLQLPTPPK